MVFSLAHLPDENLSDLKWEMRNRLYYKVSKAASYPSIDS